MTIPKFHGSESHVRTAPFPMLLAPILSLVASVMLHSTDAPCRPAVRSEVTASGGAIVFPALPHGWVSGAGAFDLRFVWPIVDKASLGLRIGVQGGPVRYRHDSDMDEQWFMGPAKKGERSDVAASFVLKFQASAAWQIAPWVSIDLSFGPAWFASRYSFDWFFSSMPSALLGVGALFTAWKGRETEIGIRLQVDAAAGAAPRAVMVLPLLGLSLVLP